MFYEINNLDKMEDELILIRKFLMNKFLHKTKYDERFKIYDYRIRFNEDINEPYKPKTFHCDFEMVIIKAINSVFPESKIKLCNFHFNQNIEKNRKKFIRFRKKI